MAPSVADKTVPASALDAAMEDSVKNLKAQAAMDRSGYNKGLLGSYPAYWPHFDLSQKYPPLEVFEHSDPGLRADPAKPNLLGKATTRDLSPFLGTEVHGVQVSKLSKEGLDELALFAAERKVVIFRDQDFKDIGFERQVEIAGYFGPLHIHPVSANAKDYPEFHVVYLDNKRDLFGGFPGPNQLSRNQWHSDVPFELQPAGTTFFWVLEGPPVGGATQFVDMGEAYRRLSPGFRKRLEGLKAVHTAFPSAMATKAVGGPLRREPIATEHPVVRLHPVTGEKALYVNKGFTTHIVGYKQEESDNLLNFLFDHIAKGTDFQVRTDYPAGTLVVWDNRVTCHSATKDYGKELRHAIRLTPQAEVPIEAKADED